MMMMMMMMIPPYTAYTPSATAAVIWPSHQDQGHKERTPACPSSTRKDNIN